MSSARGESVVVVGRVLVGYFMIRILEDLMTRLVGTLIAVIIAVIAGPGFRRRVYMRSLFIMTRDVVKGCRTCCY